MVSPNYHINFVVQTVIKLLNKKRYENLFVVSNNARGLKTPWTKFEKTNFLKKLILLKGGFQKMYTFACLTLLLSS